MSPQPETRLWNWNYQTISALREFATLQNHNYDVSTYRIIARWVFQENSVMWNGAGGDSFWFRPTLFSANREFVIGWIIFKENEHSENCLVWHFGKSESGIFLIINVRVRINFLRSARLWNYFLNNNLIIGLLYTRCIDRKFTCTK